ncbi:DUF2231 domain-containing protein [Stackebrandtia albiflava]|nr:DUF2231 domain-containing protein [Stackebrandtia albiflava]
MIEILGLPLHPLLIHLPVVLFPALALFLLGYLLVPRLRQRIGWLVMTLSVLTPAAVVAGWWSGHRFYDEHIEMITAAGASTETFENLLADHMANGDVVVWLVPPLAPLIWLFGALERGRRSAAASLTAPATDGQESAPTGTDPAAKGRRVVMVVLALVILGLAGVAGYYVFETGHTGAEAVWGTP